jgi:hypothetical protein
MNNKTLSYAFGSNVCQTSMKLSEVVSRIPFVASILDIAEEMPSYTVCKWYTDSKDLGSQSLTDGLRQIWLGKVLK